LHPEITIDKFATTYGPGLQIRWPYDPSLVMITAKRRDTEKEDFITNPIFEQHVLMLENWTIGDVFRQSCPEVAQIIDRSGNSPTTL
jgi:hypothetical protein